MKIRNGFVSNSSSSSFICEICGGVESEYDMSLEDAEMFECENGHTFHDECGKVNLSKFTLLDQKKEFIMNYYKGNITYYKEDLEKFMKEKDDISEDDVNDIFFNLDDLRYDFPEKYCPICNLKVISDENILKYVIKTERMNVDKIKDDITTNFTSLKELNNFTK